MCFNVHKSSQCAQCALMVCLRFGITFQYYSTQNVNDSLFFLPAQMITRTNIENRDSLKMMVYSFGSFLLFYLVFSSSPFFFIFYFANFLLMSEDFAHGLFNSANVIDITRYTRERPSERERERKRNKNGQMLFMFHALITTGPMFDVEELEMRDKLSGFLLRMRFLCVDTVLKSFELVNQS